MARLEVTDPEELGRFMVNLWLDPALRASFIADPVPLLEQNGVNVGPGKQIVVIEDTNDTVHIIIPVPPSGIQSQQTQDDYVDIMGVVACGGCGIRPPD